MTDELFKYADDTYLIVLAGNAALISQELDHVSQWADGNKLKLNSSKSCEMIVYQATSKIQNLHPVHPKLKSL